MPVKARDKAKTGEGFDLANNDTNIEGILKKAALFKVDIAGNIIADPLGIFHLNPSAFNESKSANWVQTAIPGQSDPVMQWVSSGARTITFDALVTADTSDFTVAESKAITEKAKTKNVKEAVATFAMKLFKVPVPPPRSTQPTKNSEVLDISDTLNYYRSLMYPTYSDPSGKGVPQRLKASPPLLVLLAGSGIARLAYSIAANSKGRITNKHDVWVLTDLRINITKQLPNLAPMEATVGFTLVQYNIRSFDKNRFHDSGE
jgi:hypothetical protein